MGCFGGDDTPQYPTIQAANVVTGQDATKQAIDLANQYFAPQMGAQAQGLSDLGMGNAYYEQYQPTSFEQALGQQQFKNIWPDEQALIMNQLSKSGMAYSPVAAETLGRSYGNLATGIGEYLNTQANTRATNNLSALLGFDPNNYYGPIANRITNQSNVQGQLTQGANEQNAAAQYANSVADYNQGLAQQMGIGTIAGGAIGFGLGGPSGAALGSGLGGALMGGSNGGQNLSSYLLASQYLPGGGLFGGSGAGGNLAGQANAFGGGTSQMGYDPASAANKATTLSVY